MKKVLKTDKQMHGHLGLHGCLPRSAFPVVPPKNEIWINKKLTPTRQTDIWVHENIEHNLMKKHGLGYERAHKIANKFEGKRKK